MRRVSWCLLLFIFIIGVCPARVAGQDATAIVRKADQKARGQTSRAEIVIEIIRPSWSRELSMKTWSKGNELALILLTAPVRDKGISFLKRGREVWNWIPSIERNIKLPPSMMSQSWMGTDFTNDDLVKEASIVEDYTHTLAGDEQVAGRPCHKVVMLPKPESAVVWGRVVLWIDKKEDLILKALYYDEDDFLVNTLIAGDIQNLGGRQLPARLEMIPADEEGHKTVMHYRSLVFDEQIEDGFFSTRNMQRVK